MLVYILSQPRSGSTVLTALLDKRKGVVCLPESSFPQVLGVVTPTERGDPVRMAALYLGSTFPPTPLSLEDANGCMAGSNDEILESLGRALAAKLGRDPAEVTTVVWKTTRTIGLHHGPLATRGKFVVLRRHRDNVFESQARFDFGVRNRHPWRYAIFAQSYEHAFSRLPPRRTIEIEYDRMPETLPRLFEFVGLEDRGEWESGASSLDLVAESCSWLTQVTEEFRSTDPEKRARLDRRQVATLDRAFRLTRPLRPFMGPVRAYFDRRSLGHIREAAKAQMTKAGE